MNLPRYIIVRSPGILTTAARLFELRNARDGWKPDPDAPEYQDTGVEGTYTRLRAIAGNMNRAETTAAEGMADVTPPPPPEWKNDGDPVKPDPDPCICADCRAKAKK